MEPHFSSYLAPLFSRPNHRAIQFVAIALVALATGWVRPAMAGPYDYLLAPPGFCGASESRRDASYPAQKRAILCLINEARRRHGVGTLVHSSCETSSPVTTCTRPTAAAPRTARLYGSAYRKVDDIVHCQRPESPGSWVHTACGRPMNYWVTQFGYAQSCSSWGWAENVYNGSGTFANARAAVTWWLNSPGHRANLLDPRWTEQGVTFAKADFQGQRNSEVWVSLFGYCR